MAMADSGRSTSTTIYAAQIVFWCQAGFQLLKSTDTGETWVQVPATGLPANVNIMAIRIQPGSKNNLVAISANSRFTGCGAGSGFPDVAPNRAYLSTDGGERFVPSTSPRLSPHSCKQMGKTPGPISRMSSLTR